jgi:hypothetical protein
MTDVGDMYRFGNYSTSVNQDGVPAAAFTDLAGVAQDPTTVTLIILKPDKITKLHYGWPSAGADGTLIRETTGRFYIDVVLDQSGRWRQRLQSTGVPTAASESILVVDKQRVTP